jgi:hypothetical protein
MTTAEELENRLCGIASVRYGSHNEIRPAQSVASSKDLRACALHRQRPLSEDASPAVVLNAKRGELFDRSRSLTEGHDDGISLKPLDKRGILLGKRTP